jgi:cysteine synthase A
MFYGPQIWKDTAGKADIFIVVSGSESTITGVGRYLKMKSPIRKN